jgi:hypothetical protein
MRAVWSRRRKLPIEPVCREFPHDAARVKLVDGLVPSCQRLAKACMQFETASAAGWVTFSLSDQHVEGRHTEQGHVSQSEFSHLERHPSAPKLPEEAVSRRGADHGQAPGVRELERIAIAAPGFDVSAPMPNYNGVGRVMVTFTRSLETMTRTASIGSARLPP